MWLTAADAINRYDGSGVKVYNLNKYFSGCSNLQQGYGFAEDNNSNIYVGSDKGLYCYTRRTDKFRLLKIYNNAPDDVAMPFAFKNDKIWCFNRFYQLATYNVKTKEIKNEANVLLDSIKAIHVYQNIENIFYYRFPIMDNIGNIWLVGKNLAACYNINSKKLNYLFTDNFKINKLLFFCSAYDTLNNILSVGTNDGVLQYFSKIGIIKHIVNAENKKLGIVNQIAIFNKALVVNSKIGVGIIDVDKNKFQKLLLPDGKSTRALNQFYFDKSGRLWTMDDGKGQKIFSFKEKLFHKIPDDNTEFSFQFGPGVSTMAELPNMDIMFQSCWILNNKNNSIYSIKKDNSILLYYSSSTDKLRNGIWHYNPLFHADKKFFTPTIFFRDSNNILKEYPRLLMNANITQLQDFVCLKTGQILLSDATGLFWFNPLKSKISIANKKANAFKINILSNGRIAVSYLNKNMLLYKHTDSSLVELQDILPDVQSFYMQEDIKTKKFWVGTNKGIYVLDNNFKTVQHFDANNGLAGTYIYGLLLDDEGNAWCSHQRGLSSINGKNYTVINYDKSDGIQDWDFNNRAFYKSTNGTLYFGGINGVNYFKPPLKRKVFYNPEIYVDEILVNGKTYRLDLNANLIEKLNLNYWQNNISLNVFVKDIESSSSQKIIYRIKEVSQSWNYLTNKAIINFSSLAAGNYTLELGIVDKFDNKEIVQKIINISIAAPLYGRVWFWLLVGIFSSAFFFWLINRRKINKQQRHLKEQLALEQQRNKITADLHDDIGASLSSLQVNSAVANQLMDKDLLRAKAIVQKLEIQSGKIAEQIGDFIWSMKPGKEAFISMSARIKNFANEILGATDVNYEVNIDPWFDTEITDATLRKNIVLITKEAINNAAKYSKAGNIYIQFTKEKTGLIITVQDNGVGFADKTIKGNGIGNMQKRAIECNGIFEIISNDRGTTVKLVLPVVP